MTNCRICANCWPWMCFWKWNIIYFMLISWNSMKINSQIGNNNKNSLINIPPSKIKCSNLTKNIFLLCVFVCVFVSMSLNYCYSYLYVYYNLVWFNDPEQSSKMKCAHHLLPHEQKSSHFLFVSLFLLLFVFKNLFCLLIEFLNIYVIFFKSKKQNSFASSKMPCTVKFVVSVCRKCVTWLSVEIKMKYVFVKICIARPSRAHTISISVQTRSYRNVSLSLHIFKKETTWIFSCCCFCVRIISVFCLFV